MDILAALNDANPRLGTKRCKLQALLDSIAEDTAGKDQLVDAVAASTHEWPAQKLTLTFTALNIPVSASLICDHRAKRCACYR